MHIDVNNAFLSWTALYLLKHGSKYDIRNSYAVIGGDEKKRAGIVLAKSNPAKKLGIKTGETLNEARKKSQAEIDRINSEVKLTEDQIAEREKEIAKADAEIDAIAKREAEAAAKKRAAEAAAKKKAQQSTSSKSSGGYTYTQPSSSGSSSAASNVAMFRWPVSSCRNITSGYGARWGTTHRGIDISGAGIQGAEVQAAKSGTVYVGCASCTHNYGKSSSCGCGGGYGNYILITHDDGTQTRYAHLQSVYVSSGTYVTQGQAIGAVGSTGYSTGFHLHFEVFINGRTVDPQLYTF